jgi:hypothetical protein
MEVALMSVSNQTALGRIPYLAAGLCANCDTVYDVELYRAGCPACADQTFLRLALALRDRGQRADRRVVAPRVFTPEESMPCLCEMRWAPNPCPVHGFVWPPAP